ncbi:hypothetical protein KR032_007497 [Drosophila birchii]|nr:hypothetical protein KR032_007497 [Drosophila birchii]
MTLVGLAARKLAQKQRSAKLASAFPNGVRCQKCLQMGHWSYECKEKRKFVHRSSRTKQLSKHLAEKEAQATKDVASGQAGENALDVSSTGSKKARRKRKPSRSTSSSSSSSDSSDSSSGSDSSSASDSSDSSSDSDDSSSESSGSGSSGSESDSSEDQDQEAPQKKKKRDESSADSSDDQE